MNVRTGLLATFGMLVLLGAGCLADSGMTALVALPDTVTSGEDFPIVVSVTNASGEDQVIESVTVSSGLYEGLFVNSTVPAEDDWEIDDFGSYTSMYDGISVANGETVDVTIDTNAVWEGDYFGSIDICFAGDIPCIYESTSVSVE